MIGCHPSEVIKIKDKILNLNNSKASRGDKLYDRSLKTTVLIGSGVEL